MMSSTSTAKVCMRCGRDCSQKPRLKDVRGRYCCRECLDQTPAPPHSVESNGAALEIEPVEVPDTVLIPCSECGRLAHPDAALCTSCGRRFKTGGREDADGLAALGFPEDHSESDRGKRAGKRPARVCASCGYDLAGLRTARCPECGTINGRMGRRRSDEDMAKEEYRWAFLKPLILLGVCLPLDLMISYFSARGNLLVEPGTAMAMHGIAMFSRATIAIGVYYACALIWLGFGTQFRLTALQLVSISSAVGLMSALCVVTGMSALSFVIPFIAQIILMYDLMDLDIQDATILTTVTFTASFAFLAWLSFAMR